MDVETILRDWRVQLAGEIQAAENERPAALAGVIEAERTEAEAAQHWRELKARIHNVVKSGTIAGALQARLADAEKAPAVLAGALTLARQRAANLEYRLADLSHAAAQLDSALTPVVVSMVKRDAAAPFRPAAVPVDLDENIIMPAPPVSPTPDDVKRWAIRVPA
jgi:hypothetical protein